jgi:predicted alpha/beta-fold hydrolase
MRRFMKSLVPKALEKARQHPGICDIEALQRARTFTEFDSVFTAPLHGFRDAEDYWTRVGCHQFLETIRVPTLLVASADDPFNHPDTLPWNAVERSPWLHALFTQTGGHVGFVSGAPHEPRYWNEEQAERFLMAYCRLSRAQE